MGIEIDCHIIRPEVRAMFEHYNAELMCANCFSATVGIKVSELGNKIIYCDGGNKVKELLHFKYFCRPGDIIMAHDFDRDIGVEAKPEVLEDDVLHLDISDDFVRIDDERFKDTRIIGWRKV
jgi:hypothetical protein